MERTTEELRHEKRRIEVEQLPVKVLCADFVNDARSTTPRIVQLPKRKFVTLIEII